MEKDIKNTKQLYYFFLILGLIGIINIASRTFFQQEIPGTELGIITLGISLLFGTTTGVIIGLLLDFSVIYLAISYHYHTKLKKMLKNKNIETIKIQNDSKKEAV